MNTQEVPLNSTEFQPRNEYILIKPAKLEEKTTTAGIIIPLQEKTGPMGRKTFGEVLAVGEAIEDLEVGAFVVFPNTDGLDLEFLDGVFVLLRYESIIGTKK